MLLQYSCTRNLILFHFYQREWWNNYTVLQFLNKLLAVLHTFNRHMSFLHAAAKKSVLKRSMERETRENHYMLNICCLKGKFIAAVYWRMNSIAFEVCWLAKVLFGHYFYTFPVTRFHSCLLRGTFFPSQERTSSISQLPRGMSNIILKTKQKLKRIKTEYNKNFRWNEKWQPMSEWHRVYEESKIL